MPYHLSKRMELELRELTDKLVELPPGRELIVRARNSQELGKLRYAIYCWLNATGLKAEFKLKTVSSTAIVVVRLGDIVPRFTTSTDSALDEIISSLVELEDEKDVKERISLAVQRGLVDSVQGAKALAEWRRIQGWPAEVDNSNC